MQDSRWSSAPSRISVARTSGAVPVSNLVPASMRASRTACAARSAAGRSSTDSSGIATVAVSQKCWRGMSSTASNLARRPGCRSIVRWRARCSATASSGPRIRCANALLKSSAAPSIRRSLTQICCWAADNAGSRSGRCPAGAVGAAPATSWVRSRSRAVRAAARSCTVGWRKTSRTPTGTPSASVSRTASCAAAIDPPPRAKKSSCGPTVLPGRSRLHTSVRVRSSPVYGGGPAVPRGVAGSRASSTVPSGRRGICASTVTSEGPHIRGSAAARSRRRPARSAAPAVVSVTTYATGRGSSPWGAVSAASRTAGRPRSTSSNWSS